MATLPKISYVLLSHNREKYIRAALESAFAQDYEGELEYIISDDCSTDRTYEIIQECVADYKGGRRVVVTQTPQNCHLAGNTNHAIQFVESDWIVRADDDDLSSVNRCSIIGRAIAEHPEATFVFTRKVDFTDADEAGCIAAAKQALGHVPAPAILDVRKSGQSPMAWFGAHNCLHQAWSMKHYRQFGPLPVDGYWVDDVVSFWRCCILGVGLDIDAVTSYIRAGSGNMCRGGDDGSQGYAAIMRQERFNDRYYNVTLSPLTETCRQLREYAAQQLSPEQQCAEPFLQALEQNLQERRILCTYWRGSTLNRFRIARKMGWTGLFGMLRCLPLPLFAACLATYRLISKKG